MYKQKRFNMVQDIDKNIFKKLIKKDNPIIFDVGAFDGNDSIEFLNIFNNANVYAFEIDDRSLELFKQYVNNSSVQLFETALSNIDGEISFYKSDSDTRKHKRHDNEKTWSASSSIKKPDNHLNIFQDISFDQVVKVKSTKLDTWISDKDIKLIDIMWVDVNGGEEEFLNGAINTINNKVNYLYIEFNAVDNEKGQTSLYENCITKNDICKKLNQFEEIGVYNFMGNFGNVLLKNKNIS